KNTVKTLELQKDWYHQTQLALKEKEVKFVESLARLDKWEESSKNLAKLLYSSMSTRTKLGLGFKEYIGFDEVCNISTPSVFDLEPEDREVKSLYERFVKAGKMHEVSPPIIGTFMPTTYKSDLAETQDTFGSKSNTSSLNTSDIHDFVSCDNSDKSSASETYTFTSCVSSPRPMTPSLLLIKSHLIKDCDVYDTVDNFPFVVSKAASVLAGSRHSSASTSTGRSIPAASRNRPASIHADRSIPATCRNRPADDGVLLLSPQHVVLREFTDLICNGGPRTMVDLINLHGFVYPHMNKDICIVDSGCSRSMTGNKEKLDDFVQVKGGNVTFGGGDSKITGKGTIRTSKLNFENVYYVEELQNFNLFFVS
nr:ribonuclease H-like domain-containing protein [Tanacetum cinerariifolium]GFA78094.1 ribonuclease H-like domain-containing protein [Tanacetum cinerariifolium]GFB17962.1 ribonuclease H-like domain-containing protein [Tanacetum cinerariifolium]